MVGTPALVPFATAQHLVLDGVSWDFYEHVLAEIGDCPVRVTFDRGRIEIMSPLPEHELLKKPMARLIEMMCFERRISLVGLGNTTFRDDASSAALSRTSATTWRTPPPPGRSKGGSTRQFTPRRTWLSKWT
jgi:hypothetical protein